MSRYRGESEALPGLLMFALEWALVLIVYFVGHHFWDWGFVPYAAVYALSAGIGHRNTGRH